MKKILFLGLLLFLVFPLISAINQFSGTWINTDRNTSGITKISIRISGTNVYVHAWGKCHPRDCDWGEVPAYAFSQSPSSSVRDHALAVIAVFRNSYSKTFFILKPVSNRLKAEVYTHYTGNGRNDFKKTYYFKKGLSLIHPGQMMIVLTKAPKQLSPADGTVFNHYPRVTTLRWASLPGAVSYTVEVQYIEPCGHANCRARLWKLARNITRTYYTFTFVGAQPGRWRVWGVDSRGRPGPKSPWWTFKYLR